MHVVLHDVACKAARDGFYSLGFREIHKIRAKMGLVGRCKFAGRFSLDVRCDRVVTLQEFIRCHDGAPKFRRPVLAIVGGTRLGKSILAAQILQRIGKNLGLLEFLEVTVEDSEQMDMADFDRGLHAGVLLDGVGDALFLKRNREALQGRAKLVKGARSATNIYSYSYSLCGRAVVATFDLSALNLKELTKDHWLSNRENVMLLELKEPAFARAELAISEATPERRPARKRRCWLSSPRRELAFQPELALDAP